MNPSQLTSFIAVIVPRIIAILIEKRNVTEKEAIKLLYNSELYESLEHEETKLWHLSAETLYALLDEELTTGKITYPEEI